MNNELTLHTEGWYDSAHHLENYDGPCANLHGHTYKLECWVKGNKSKLQKNGILWDFGILKEATKLFDHNGDATNIMKENSSAENQCLFFYNYFKNKNPKLKFKVRVYEQIQPKQSYCEYGDF